MSSADRRVEFAAGTRLRVWSHIWRYALVVVLSAIGWMGVYGYFAVQVDEGKLPDSTLFWALAIIDPIVWLIAMALLPLRRRIPATVAIVTGALSGLSAMVSIGPAQLAIASNATRRRWKSIVASVAAGAAGSLLYSRFVPAGYVGESSIWADILGAAVGFALPVVFGLYIGARRALISTLSERALEAERERELQVAAAQAGERTRIAREMHDVLAHRISLVAMHAGALAYREDLSPEQVRATAVLVQDNSRRALTELRQVLGVLRAENGGVEPPQPSLETLPALIAEARAAGAAIDSELGVTQAPDLISRTTFRIVQEALTNARKHAPGAAIRVRVEGHAGGLLTVEITNGAAVAMARGGGSAAPIPGSGMVSRGLPSAPSSRAARSNTGPIRRAASPCGRGYRGRKTMNDRVSVVLVDDDPLVRAGLTMMLGGGSGIEIAGEAANGREGVDLIATMKPDVALMDIRMPVMDGLAAVRAIVASGSTTRVIVLTTFDADDMVLTALADGAAGFLLKDTPPADLVDAVRRVSRGEPILSPSVTTQLIAAATRSRAGGSDARQLAAALTDREREVALAVARGLSNAEIAAELFLGVATVKTHIAHLFTKLDAGNRVQLARRVHEAGLR